MPIKGEKGGSYILNLINQLITNQTTRRDRVMSIKRNRISMLVSLSNTIGDIEADAENQTTEILQSNMKIVRDHVRDILKLDGVVGISPNSIK